jgi:hypothetical protein
VKGSSVSTAHWTSSTSTPGIAAVNAKHGVVTAAIEQQTADMAQYVATT